MSDLENFLEKKELFYKDIDYKFMPNLWQSIKHRFKLPKIVPIVGTNGKGSTGRFLAYYLFKAGFKTGHFTSPHILEFRERFWIDNQYADDIKLDLAHQSLQEKLDFKSKDKISYFEYATLLAIELFSKCDYIILEAGLGGEYDATNVFDKLFSLVTPISFDHQNFLGDTIEEIALTKLNSITTFALIANQQEKVYDVIEKNSIKTTLSSELFSKKEIKDIEDFILKNSFASYLKENLTLSMSGVKKLGIDYDLTYLDGVKLFGRCHKITTNITIDVGHNLLAGKALAKEFKDKKIILIYNTYKDKDFYMILKTMKPIIKEVQILEVKNDRIVDIDELKDALKKLDINYSEFESLSEKQEYLVFGSFSVVEQFLKNYSIDHKIDYL